MPVLDVPRPAFMAEDEIRIFEDSVGRFFEQHAPPARVDRWRANGMVEREFYREAGAAGILGVTVPEAYGGPGGDFRHDVVVIEQCVAKDIDGFWPELHNIIVLPYILLHATEEQKRRWLPGLISGEIITAIAMTEPGTGSDLQGIRTTARRDGNGYRLNGAKTFISNGQIANFILVVARTDPEAGSKGFSLLVLETEGSGSSGGAVEGFRRGRKLDKIGNDAQDTSELFFEDVWVPATNLLGPEEGRGLPQLMQELPKERLGIAIKGMACIERALEVTIDYVKQRRAFGQPILDFQNTRFKLAECKTEATVARVFVNDCIARLLRKELDTTTASMAKYWVTDLQCKIIDECLQLHGGYGYINEYPIARLYRDARIQRIYGGTNEIMKLVIGRSL